LRRKYGCLHQVPIKSGRVWNKSIRIVNEKNQVITTRVIAVRLNIAVYFTHHRFAMSFVPGVAAMRVLPPVHHDVGLVALSGVIAIGTSVVARWSAFNLRLETIFTAFWKKAGSATIMAAGICLMHYTGMAAAKFTPDSISTAAAHLPSRPTGRHCGTVWLLVMRRTLELIGPREYAGPIA
jgi:NO-binding membrane sensor protein with MHYT domain